MFAENIGVCGYIVCSLIDTESLYNIVKVAVVQCIFQWIEQFNTTKQQTFRIKQVLWKQPFSTTKDWPNLV